MPAHVVEYELVYTVDGHDRTGYVKADPAPAMESQLGSVMSSFACTFYDPAQSWVPEVWQDFVVTHGETVVFGGKIISVRRVPQGISDAGYEVQAYDWGVVVNHTDANGRWDGVTDQSLIQALFARYLPDYDATTYVGSAGLNLGTVTINYRSLGYVLDILCRTTGWNWYIDENKALHYFAPTASDAPFGLSDMPDNETTFAYAKDSLQLTVDGSDIRNRVTFIGGVATYDMDERFTGDGTTTKFVLAHPYSHMRFTFIYPGPGLVSVGTLGVHEFGSVWNCLYSPSERAIYVDPTLVPADGATVRIGYNYEVPLTVRRQDTASWLAYGTTWFDYAILDREVFSRDVAVARADAVLAEYATARTSGSVRLYKPGLRAGQRVHITNAALGIDGDYLIQRMSLRSYSRWYFEITIEFGSWNPRLVDLLLELSRQQGAAQFDTIETLYDYITPYSELSFICGTPVITGGTEIPVWDSFRWSFALWQ